MINGTWLGHDKEKLASSVVVADVGTIGGEERLNSRLRWWFFGFGGWYGGAQEKFREDGCFWLVLKGDSIYLD